MMEAELLTNSGWLALPSQTRSMGASLNTLGLKEAAEFVRLHPVTLSEWARQGKIPGASKPGKEWVFIELGLVAYLNSKSPCPFTGEAASGGSSFPRNKEELENLLGLPTKRPRRNSTKRGKARYGDKTG
jgi:hypothetical protein